MEDYRASCRATLCFYVNGREVNIENPDPELSLLYYLRQNLRLTGTKQGCNEGGCGACTAMISRYDPITDKIRHFSVTACLISICSLDGVAVTTIEGIGSTKTKLHPCQERIARCHGTQCGFCTPGMVMSMYTLLRNNPQPTEQEMEKTLRGNLCRCNGYRPVLDSFRSFCIDCSCRSISVDEGYDDDANFSSKFSKYDPTQEPIFPPKLKILGANPAPLCLQGPRVNWYRPVSLDQLLLLRDRFPLEENENQSQNRIVGGCSIVQIGQTNVDHSQVLISVDCVAELKTIKLIDDGLVVGAAVTVAELEARLMELLSTVHETDARIFSCLLEMVHRFGSPQSNNKLTLGGIVMMGYHASDIVPILIASSCKLLLAMKGSSRQVIISSSSFIGGTSILRTNEILVSITVPYSHEDEHIACYKQSRRRYLDPSIANACMWVKMDGITVRDCRLVFGNMGTHVVTASKTMEAICQSKKWNSDLFSTASKILSKELALPSNIAEGMAEYRLTLCLSFFYKFFLKVTQEMIPNSIPLNEMSILKPLVFGTCKNSPGFQVTKSSQQVWDIIGLPVMNYSAMELATGEAKFVDDTPIVQRELFAGFVLSECAHGTFTIDKTALKGIKGVIDFISAKDVPGSNKTGVHNNDFLFADGTVTAVGQIIGIVVAKDRLTAQRGAKSVKVTYNELPAILTIEEAIAAGNFFIPDKEISLGNIHDTLEKAEHRLEGEVRVGGQEHFYMETCSCVCVPKAEKGEMEIIASTEDLGGLQRCICQALKTPPNRINTRVKRLGGSFGGKDVRSNIVYTAVSVAANKLRAPIRAVLERSEDMVNKGGRHPFKGVYNVAFTKTGQVTGLYIDVYANGGCSTDVSIPVIEKAVYNLQSVYKIPNMRVVGRVCQTNLPSNTSMNGSGGPQALIIMEHILSCIADSLGLEKMHVQEMNLLENGDHLACGDIINDCTIRRCWDTLKTEYGYEKKKNEVKEYNRCNKWKKRGISLVPTIHSLGDDSSLMVYGTQAEASIQVYTDGTVLLTYGGIDIGQGLDTKMIQVCAECLDIPAEMIHVNEPCTDKILCFSNSPNLIAMAIQNACDKIKKRIIPFIDEDPDAGWENWVIRAYISRVPLSVKGFYKTRPTTINRYYSYGVGCSVVEIDTLTGDHKVISADLVMDVGNRINPAIDIGQVEGAFTQGLGLFTMEECVLLKDGRKHTVGPRTYKIPGCSDIPIELNVTLLDRHPNPEAIFAADSLCEPPLYLAASVFFAIKEAVKSARYERGITGPFDFWSPATTERIRMICKDQFVEMSQADTDMMQDTWNIIP